MGKYKIKKGLKLPINGEPNQTISDGKAVKHVALIGDDYVGMKPTMQVKVGDVVKKGQVVFSDKKLPKVSFTSPGSGKVVEINRGAKRHFESLVIELQGEEELTFESFSEAQLKDISKEKVTEVLLQSGVWPVIRVRPFSKVADPDTTPNSIFVNAMDTNPLAPSMEQVLAGKENQFKNGLLVLTNLTEGKIHLCKKENDNIPTVELSSLSVEEFSGPHPAGNTGTHVHFVDPVGSNKQVWVVNAQDVITIGKLFTTGKIDVERIVSLAGPSVQTPKLVKTRAGANLNELTNGELKEGKNRIISGSVLSGRSGINTFLYLGRYHQSVSVISDEVKRDFLGWLTPGFNLFSIKPILISSLFRNKKFDFNTATNGGHRAIVPIGSYEKVMPLDILPTFLLRALAVDDLDEAEKLGCLELDEEDLALCTYVCPAKIEHGPILRRNLNLIEKEG